MQFARDLDTASADKFVGMYVNELTLEYGEPCRSSSLLACCLPRGGQHCFVSLHECPTKPAARRTARLSCCAD